MPRRNGPRHAARGLPSAGGSEFQCIGCPARVSAARLACPRCWARIPRSVRDGLRVPYGKDPRAWDGLGYQEAVAHAAAWLARGRQLSEAAGEGP